MLEDNTLYQFSISNLYSVHCQFYKPKQSCQLLTVLFIIFSWDAYLVKIPPMQNTWNCMNYFYICCYVSSVSFCNWIIIIIKIITNYWAQLQFEREKEYADFKNNSSTKVEYFSKPENIIISKQMVDNTNLPFLTLGLLGSSPSLKDVFNAFTSKLIWSGGTNELFI